MWLPPTNRDLRSETDDDDATTAAAFPPPYFMQPGFESPHPFILDGTINFHVGDLVKPVTPLVRVRTG